jgi:protein involved in polysaccharide export with SLBB domain
MKRTLLGAIILSVCISTALSREKSKHFHGYYRGYLEEYAAATLPEDADQSIAVIGLVQNPNTIIPPSNGLTVTKAIDQAGGFAPFADHAHVGIWRTDDGRFLMTNVYEVKEGKAPDLFLLKGDIVIVTDRWM